MSKLIAAVQADDIEEVKRLVEDLVKTNQTSFKDQVTRVDIDERYRLGLKGLFEAQISRFVDEKDRLGMTALMWSCIKGRIDIAEYLLERGANVNLRTNTIDANGKIIGVDNGKDALIFACGARIYALVELLLKFGADINFIPNNGFTALANSALAGDVEMTSILLNKGGGIDIVIKSYAFFAATQNKHINVMNLLASRGADINIIFGETNALMYAAKVGEYDFVETLLDQGAEVELINQQGRNALMMSLLSGKEDVVRLLLERGADVNVKDYFGNTTVMLAVQSNQSSVLKLVIDKGANIDSINDKGNSPLMVAVFYESFEIAKMLGEAGASLRNLDILVGRYQLPEKISQLAKAFLYIDKVLIGDIVLTGMNEYWFADSGDDAKSSDDNHQFHLEHIEALAARIIHRLTQTTLITNFESLKNYLAAHVDRISAHIVCQIEEAMVVNKIANSFYDGKIYDGDLTELSPEIIDKINFLFAKRVEEDIWKKRDYSKMLEVLNQRSWPEKLKKDIAFLIGKYNLAHVKGDESPDEEEVWDWTPVQRFSRFEMSDGTVHFLVVEDEVELVGSDNV